MDTQDPTAPQPSETAGQPEQPAGGIGIAEPETAGFTPETIIIPPITSGGTPVQQPASPPPPQPNPFIPNVVVPPSATPPVAGETRGFPLGRIILILAIGVLVLLAILFGKAILGRVAGPKEATLAYWGLWENDGVMQKAIADFQAKNPSIKIQYIKQSPRQYRERLQAAIDRGEGPDVFRFHNTWVPMLKNQLAPATVMTAAEFSSTFFPVASSDLAEGSTIFGMPLMIDGLGLYINEDLLATAGVTPPSTWTELLNIVPKLTVKNGSIIVTSAIALGTAGNIEHFSDILGMMFLQNGANLVQFTGRQVEETLIFYRKFSDPSDPLYTWSEAMDNSIYAFATGRVAMILAPSWRAFDIKQINPQLRFRIVAAPQLPGNTVTWASYWVEGVSSRSKYQNEAWQFVKYLTSREGATTLYTEAAKVRLFGEPYARVDLAKTVEEDPYVGAYVKQAPFARSFPLASRTFDNGLNDKLIKYLEDAVNSMASGNSATRAVETAAAGFRQVLSTYGLVSSSPASQ